MPRTSRLALSLALVLATYSSGWAQTPSASRQPVLTPVHEAMTKAIDSTEVASAVTCVATPDDIIHLDATGLADIATNRSAQVDDIFWIASMSKPITTAAVLILQDQGKLSLEDPVSKYLPEFENLKTADGRPAPVTLRHLLTHTSGMGEISSEVARDKTTLAEVTPLYAQLPTSFDPGTKWAYCQSGINTSARVVEVVSGQDFATFLDQKLFQPLHMNDTTFYLTDAQLPRLATSYKRDDDGTLAPAENFILYGKSPTSRDRFPAANGGLFSTATDYARFCRMLLNDGTLTGTRFLSLESVKLMSTLQTADLSTGFTPGNGWAIGCCVVRQPEGVTAMLSPGTFGHGGAFGTQAWIDPVMKRAYILMVQRSNFPNADNSPIRAAFQTAAIQALDHPADPNAEPARPLFDGETLTGWIPTDFSGAGEVTVQDGLIHLNTGKPMTGITTSRDDLPRINYEIRFQAMRTEGNDFFAALTFPVADTYATLVNGGWGNSVTGISRLDGADASENDSSAYFPYKNNTWYRFRLQVTPKKFIAWVDDRRVVNVLHEGRHVDTRLETRVNQPLGFATYRSTALLKYITIRPLTDSEITTAHADTD